MLPRIFIASSSEGLETAKDIYSKLSNLNFAKIDLWNMSDCFKPGSFNLQSLVDCSKLYDFAVILLTPDDKTTYRDKECFSPRDNVVLEMGLFIGEIGIDRTIIVCKRNANIKKPTDIDGLIFLSYDRRDEIAGVCINIENHIKSIGEKKTLAIKGYPSGSAAYKDIKSCTVGANKIHLIGVCLNLFHEDYYKLINERAESGAKVIISLADPGKKIITFFRKFIYGNEHKGKCPTKVTVYKTLELMLNKKDITHENIELKLFRYPVSFAVMIFNDNDIFLYPYGYKKRGDQSPVFYFQNEGTEFSNFFLEVSKSIIDESDESYDKIKSWKPKEKEK